MSDIDVEPVDHVDEGSEDDGRAGEDSDHAGDVPDHADDDGLDAVAPDDDWVATVDAPEYVLYGGKGGVGKTTMAAATGLASASEGVRTLVVSTDPAHSLSDTLEADVAAEPTRVREDAPLYAVEIDPDSVVAGPFADAGEGGFGGDDSGGFGDDGAGDPFDDDPFGGDAGGPAGTGGPEGPGGSGGAGGPFGGGGGQGQGSPFGGDGPMGGLGELLGEGGPLEDGGPLGGPMPGADEAAAMQQLLRFMDDDRFDRVVVDTAPTGHTLRLLELPDVMDSMVGRALKIRQTIGGMMGRVGGLFGGGDDAGDESPDGLSEEEVDDLEALQERIERLRGTLRDPARTDFRIVMVPEEMSVLESERLRDRLDAFGIPVGMVVVNRVLEDLADVTDTTGSFVSPNHDTCEFCARRWEVQQEALARAQDLFRDHGVARVPLFAEEVRGEKSLRVVAACLSA